MSDTEERLADIERRLQQLELTGPRPIDPTPPQPRPPLVIARELVFWLGLVGLGIIIWEFSSRLAK